MAPCQCLVWLSLCLSVAATDFRYVPYEDILKTASQFRDPGVTFYSQFYFDVSRNQLIVGARDSIFRLSLADLKVLEKALWLAPDEKVQMCQDKGQSDNDCHNFIKVLLSNGKRLFTCGTNAFAPECTWREIESVNKVIERVPGVAKSPYSPHANITALMTARGQYFVGSPTDFSGTDSAITRTNGHPASQSLRTNQFDSKWLNEPQFVGSFETDKFVFFLFREAAVEYINCGKIIYSRIARVCKNDEGGQLLLKDNWTTFLKARLNCSMPGEYPFYFDEIQGMAYNEDEKIIYATFTTPSNSIPGSAICSFNASAIEEAFSGPFKYQSNPGAAWEKDYSQNRDHFECEIASASHSHLIDSSRYQLMDSAVQPMTPKPLYNSNMETLVHIAIDTVRTKLNERLHMLFVSTSDGKIKKLSVLPRTKETCLIEVWNPSPRDHPVRIHKLQYLKETDSVYVGADTGVLRIPTSHCERHKTKEACHNAMDPHCGWNELLLQCTTAPEGNPHISHWLQSVTQCPLLDVPVDGGWGSWSNWFPCSHQGDQHSDENVDQCKCKNRECNNPTPQNGGAPCSGISIAVTNCTVHGAWTSWSAWSKCSQTCGIATKVRYRTCGNPAPAHGGRVCLGSERDELYCTTKPPCPSKTPPPRDGQWTEWGDWSGCSSPCGGGFRSRQRSCYNPDGGQDCNGCHVDYEPCNTHGCAEGKKTGWTPWIPMGNVSGRAGYVEKRFKFLCRAPVHDAGLIKMSQAKEEERFCYNSGSCGRSGHGVEARQRVCYKASHSGTGRKVSDCVDVAMDRAAGGCRYEGACSAKNVESEDPYEWSAWSVCTKSCGGGVQERTRMCGGNCDETLETRACNTHSCSGEWGCWTEWSECSVTCGSGRQARTRICLLDKDGGHCEGSGSEHKRCERQSCHSLQGWDNWSVWSACDSNEKQYRMRKCLTSNPGPQICQGPDVETRTCILGKDVDLGCALSPSVVSKGYVGVGVVLGCSLAAFLLGLLAAIMYTYYCQKRRRVRIPGSPHYISSKQNPYVTIPLRETPKRTPSSASNGSGHKTTSNGTIPSKIFSKPAEYETATIKRNSHNLVNGHAVRAQLDEDQFF